MLKIIALRSFGKTFYSHMIQRDSSLLKQIAFASCEKLWMNDDYQNKAGAKIKDEAILFMSLKC